MLGDFFETRPGRAQVFFRILKDVALLIVGPSAALQGVQFDNELGKQVVLTAIPIYAEATVSSLIDFIDAIRFWRIWRAKKVQHAYTRRLRGIDVPDFLVPLRETETGVQVIPRWRYFLLAIVAAVIAIVVAIPSILVDEVVFINNVLQKPAEYWLVAVSLLLLIIIGTGGNILTGFLFFFERLDTSRMISIQTSHVKSIIPVLYCFWLIFESVVMFSRIRVHTSSDPRMRALANIYLLRVTTDVAVLTKQNRFGHIAAGKMYVNLQEYCGAGIVSIDKEKVTQEVALTNIAKLS